MIFIYFVKAYRKLYNPSYPNNDVPLSRRNFMERRKFIGRTLAGGAIFSAAAGLSSPPAAHAVQSKYLTYTDDLVIEREVSDQPHKGKVLAAIQPHSDDIPNYAAGTVAKLIKEGYTGYLIRTSNDDHAGPGSVGETCVANERDNEEVARVLGLKKVFNLDYRNHRMDDIDEIELRARLILLFRTLKIDTVISYDPCCLYEENPDHCVTAKAVEAACWMAGGRKDYPEHFRAGLEPHSVSERYYHARGPLLVNRIVEITSVIEKKIRSTIANIAQGPAGDRGAQLRRQLAKENKKLAILGDDDDTANYQFVKQFHIEHESELGKRHGLDYAEAFHYIGPEQGWHSFTPKVREYIQDHAEPLR